MTNKKAQVWIETVLYTLIGLALIAMVLAFAMPKINESRDRLVVEQTLGSLNDLDLKINEVLKAPGNIRNILFTMKKGELYIDADNEKVIFVLSDLSKPYSEPGVKIQEGRIEIITTQGQKTNSVNMSISYANRLDFVNPDEESVKKYNAASTPYNFIIENKGNTNIGMDLLDEVVIREAV